MQAMMPAHLRPVLRVLELELRAAFGGRLRDVRLFGSYARGEASEDSDVDVLVLVDELAPAEIAAVSDAATKIALATGAALAPLPMASERYAHLAATGRALAVEIERDGQRP
jgi:predicted nucleotidyltransferase